MPQHAPKSQTPPDDAPLPERTGLRWWRWLAPFPFIAIALHFLPGETGDEAGAVAMSATPASVSALGPALDPTLSPAPSLVLANQIDEHGQTFPGSAYFYAEGAFDPATQDALTGRDALPEKWRGDQTILPINIGPAPAAYRFTGRTRNDRERALTCLGHAVYYEAANEPDAGQRAVAQVVLNRVRHAAWPDSVCGVVYDGSQRDDLHCQFTFACNGSMARPPQREKWERALRVASIALNGEPFAPVGLSTYYHSLAVHPGWADQMAPAAIINAHIFYRTPGAQGAAERFTQAYAGRETRAPGTFAYVAPKELAQQIERNIALPAFPAATPAALPTPATPTSATPTSATPMPPTSVMQPQSAPIGPSAKLDGLSGRTNLPQSTVKEEFRNSGRLIAPVRN